jgi:predicted Zn-dependent protease
VTVRRAAMLVAAAVAIAWLGVSYRDARLIRHAQVVAANPKATPPQFESALADARDATTLDPGTGAESLSYQASLEIRFGRPADGLRHLEELVRREPDTAEAWFLIAQLTQKRDPARSAEARARLHELDPLGAPAP